MSYLNSILQMSASGEINNPKGQVCAVTVAHDSWCRALKSGSCNCNPTIQSGAPKPNRAQRRAGNKGSR